jgi:ribulose 1,5-bisphosphate synthetase/thiazole synthase
VVAAAVEQVGKVLANVDDKPMQHMNCKRSAWFSGQICLISHHLQVDVAIIGGGPGGMATALSIQRCVTCYAAC